MLALFSKLRRVPQYAAALDGGNTQFRQLCCGRVLTALGAYPKILSARDDLLRKSPTHDMTLFDAFEDIMWALGHVEAQVDATEEENRVLSGQAAAIRVQVSEFKEFLVGHGNYGGINMVPLRTIGTEFGYKALLRAASTVTSSEASLHRVA